MLPGRALVDLVRSRCVVVDLPGGRLGEPIEEVGVINCAFVLEEDVMDLARMTVCRIVMRNGDDYCRKSSVDLCYHALRRCGVADLTVRYRFARPWVLQQREVQDAVADEAHDRSGGWTGCWHPSCVVVFGCSGSRYRIVSGFRLCVGFQSWNVSFLGCIR